MAAPLSSIIFGKTIRRWRRIHFWHLALSIFCQKRKIPSTSLDLLRGITSLLMNSFNSCQTFSIGLASGDSGKVFHQHTPFSSMNARASLYHRESSHYMIEIQCFARKILLHCLTLMFTLVRHYYLHIWTYHLDVCLRSLSCINLCPSG